MMCSERSLRATNSTTNVQLQELQTKQVSKDAYCSGDSIEISFRVTLISFSIFFPIASSIL